MSANVRQYDFQETWEVDQTRDIIKSILCLSHLSEWYTIKLVIWQVIETLKIIVYITFYGPFFSVKYYNINVNFCFHWHCSEFLMW